MPASAMASGIPHEQFNDHTMSFENVDNWLFDSERLTTWQIQLVDCCEAINEQLNQIRMGLETVHGPRESKSPVIFRVIGGMHRPPK